MGVVAGSGAGAETRASKEHSFLSVLNPETFDTPLHVIQVTGLTITITLTITLTIIITITIPLTITTPLTIP